MRLVTFRRLSCDGDPPSLPFSTLPLSLSLDVSLSSVV